MPGPIAVHHTETTDAAWDGPAAEANLNVDATEAYYRSAFAYQRADADPTTKAAYAFIHHLVASDGSIGAADMVACSSAIAVLNGGRGGATTIPSDDYPGIWSHLAAHLRDGDREPPELNRSAVRQASPPTERRQQRDLADAGIQLRQVAGQELPQIVGHAALFNVESQVIADWFGGFREKVKPGAFKKTLRDGADVVALFNHNPDYVLGRNKAGTLRLWEDDIGLAYEIDPPPTDWARALMVTMRRGDIDGSSYGFLTVQDDWGRTTDEDGRELDLHWLIEAKLRDVSVVTFPATVETDASVRSLLTQAGLPGDVFFAALARSQRGLSLSDDHRGALREVRRFLDSLVGSEAPTAPARPSHAAPAPAPRPSASAHLADLRRQLERYEHMRI